MTGRKGSHLRVHAHLRTSEQLLGLLKITDFFTVNAAENKETPLLFSRGLAETGSPSDGHRSWTLHKHAAGLSVAASFRATCATKTHRKQTETDTPTFSAGTLKHIANVSHSTVSSTISFQASEMERVKS